MEDIYEIITTLMERYPQFVHRKFKIELDNEIMLYWQTQTAEFSGCDLEDLIKDIDNFIKIEQ